MKELRRNHGLFRRLQRGVSQENEEKVREAIEGLQMGMKCPKCSQARAQLMADLRTEKGLSEIASSMKAVSGRGAVIKVPCNDLRYCKESISDAFDHGPQSGMKLAQLVQKLVSGEESVSELMLTAVRFHGDLYVIEGNKRLWCLKEAQREVNQTVMASVHVPDLYLGFVQRQGHKEPALPYFLQRFHPACGGESVEVCSSLFQEVCSSSGCHVPDSAAVSTAQESPSDQHGQRILTMGKHKGKSYAEVYADTGYRNWVLNNIGETSAAEMKALKQYFLDREGSSGRASQPQVTNAFRSVQTPMSAESPSDQHGQRILTMGKHKGKSYAQVYADTGYRNWVLNKMKALKQYFLDREGSSGRASQPQVTNAFRSVQTPMSAESPSDQHGQRILTMGKHKGKSYAQVYADTGYRNWVLNKMKALKQYFLDREGSSGRASQPQVTNAFRPVQTPMSAESPSDQHGQRILTMGKHKGKSYAEVYADTGYRNWVLNNIGETSAAEMKALKQYFLDREGSSGRASQP